MVKWPRLDFTGVVEDKWTLVLALISNLNLAILTPSSGSEDMRKPKTLARIGQHCLCFRDKTAAVEEEECVGQHPRARGPLMFLGDRVKLWLRAEPL